MPDQGTEELNREMALRAHADHLAIYVDSRKAAIDSANAAIRAMILVNGGAVLALLAFLGALEDSNEGSVKIAALVDPIGWFAWGVGFAVVTAALAYVVNMLDAYIVASIEGQWEHPYRREGRLAKWLKPIRAIAHISALGLAAAALYSFSQGVSSVSTAITGLGL